jgi:cell division protein FtsL
VGEALEVNIILFIITVLSAIGVVSVALTRQVLFYSRRSQLLRLQDRNRDYARQQDELDKRYRDAQELARQTETERKAQLTQVADLQRRAKAAALDNYIIIHEMGEPGGNRRLFVAPLHLSSMITIGQTVIKEPRLRSSKHMLEAWAETVDDANRAAKLIYAQEAGFTLSRLVPPATT